MKVLTLDVESTISNKGNPFDLTNKCVCVGVKYPEWDSVIYWQDVFEKLQFVIDRAPMLCGFNIKFDLHWLRKIGIDISKVKVWDCQLAEFILNNQETPYPSLDSVASKYGLQPKLDVVKLEYWDKGIDTDMIPKDILSNYLNQDLVLTEQIYFKQLEQFQTNGKYTLFKLHCQDLLVLEEMEWNGIQFNTEKALQHAKEIEKELNEISDKLLNFTTGAPINLNSNDDLSCLLYGGSIRNDVRIPVGVYKTGAKTGQTRYKVVTKEYPLPRLVEPLKGTEVSKPAGSPEYWKVNETVLKQVKLNKEAKKVVDLLNNYGKLEKLRGTYLTGYSKLIASMNWEKDMLHGTLNQCVAITGRLSSSKPNLQNADPITKVYMETIHDS